ncbi:MAG TPA: gephyrin-like molybdotransferase Glp [Acidimicrobiales bacterium]|nr:gephyrin-like molybdotransferase Glp [Acidimicrobiales bacterium]
MISLAEAQAHALALARPPRVVEVALLDAVGCVLAKDVVTEGPVPPFANSAMDGYAVRAEDTANAPVALVVVDTIAAGSVTTRRVEPGTAMRVMTGAPIPAGADAIVMVERTAARDTEPPTVEIQVAVERGLFVREAGTDLGDGATVLRAGEIVQPAHAGLLAAAGCAEVCVYRPPLVGVLSSGDELVDPPQLLGPGQIRDANRPALLATLRAEGVRTRDLGAVPDEGEALDDALAAAAASCDLVLSTGGVSMGDHDLIKTRLTSFQVAIKPAKPVAMGHIDGTPVIGLPGNPVSALVSYELFARPLIRRLAGYGDNQLFRPVVTACATEAMTRAPDGKLHLLRVIASHDDHGQLCVVEAGAQASHVLSAMAAANALALIPDGEGAAAGDEVSVMLLR